MQTNNRDKGQAPLNHNNGILLRGHISLQAPSPPSKNKLPVALLNSIPLSIGGPLAPKHPLSIGGPLA